MNTISLISTSTVQAEAQEDPSSPSLQRVELTPWDLQLLTSAPIQTGLLFNNPQNLNTSSLLHRLKTSLSRALRFFPPLSGRLAATDHQEDNTTSFYIDCNNAGAQLVHAVADSLTVADIIDAVYVPDVVSSLFPLNGVKNNEGVTKPLLAVQVTELTDGGIFLGAAMNHLAVDGTSFWLFLNSWSEISRGSDAVSKLPSLKRWFLENVNSPIRIPTENVKPSEYESVPVPVLRVRAFHFSKRSIVELKEKANAEMGTDQISSLQALLAHLWRCIVRSQCLEPETYVLFVLAIGVRGRLQPPLPAHYFGNAVQGTAVLMKAGEVVEHGIGHTAWEMNQAIGSHTHEKVKSYLESWAENPILVSKWDRKSSDFLYIGNSPSFDVYGNDFGWGKPIATRHGDNEICHGKIQILPGPEEGSIDIEVCLFPETLQNLGEDAEFMHAIRADSSIRQIKPLL